MRKVPVFATLVVLIAVLAMVALGVWQLQRKAEKEALLARYALAAANPAAVPWPATREKAKAALFHRSHFECAQVGAAAEIAGRSAAGEAGWAHTARCTNRAGQTALIALGWSKDPAPRRWSGGVVTGTLGPAGPEVKLVADPPQAGLAQLAAPNPADVPNNHLAYAVQWFLFAATALVIYILALRRRWRA